MGKVVLDKRRVSFGAGRVDTNELTRESKPKCSNSKTFARGLEVAIASASTFSIPNVFVWFKITKWQTIVLGSTQA